MGVIKGGETFAARQINKAVLGGGKVRDWKQGTEGRQQDWNQLDVSYKKIKQSRKKTLKKTLGKKNANERVIKGKRTGKGKKNYGGKTSDRWWCGGEKYRITKLCKRRIAWLTGRLLGAVSSCHNSGWLGEVGRGIKWIVWQVVLAKLTIKRVYKSKHGEAIKNLQHKLNKALKVGMQFIDKRDKCWKCVEH